MASNGSDSSDDEILHSFLFFDVLKDGRIKFLTPPYPINITPPADDPLTGVKIKDVKISDDVSARIFLPPSAASSAAKLPVFLYFHGGGFCFHSAFSAEYTRILTGIVAEGNIIAVSVEYRLFPTVAIAACYDDCRAALHWVISHATGAGPDPWLNLHADFNRLFIGGDSAGGNISHALAVRAGSGGLPGGVALEGMILIHPYFKEDDKMWLYMWGPSNEGPRDRRMWPHPDDVERVGCGRVLVVLAEKDILRDAGKFYAEELRRSGWKGRVEIMENKDKGHCFHVRNHEDEEALAMQQRIISFIYHPD